MKQLIQGILLVLFMMGGAQAAIDAYEFESEA